MIPRGQRLIKSPQAREYADQVSYLWEMADLRPMSGQFKVRIVGYVNDYRLWDVDNLPKLINDSLCRAGAYPDDSVKYMRECTSACCEELSLEADRYVTVSATQTHTDPWTRPKTRPKTKRSQK